MLFRIEQGLVILVILTYVNTFYGQLNILFLTEQWFVMLVACANAPL